jgi:cytochrome c-type biogenesis protein CcmF
LAAKAQITLSRGNKTTIAEPLYIIRDSIPIPDIVTVEDWGLKLALQQIDPHDGSFTLAVWEHDSIKKDFIVMQAIVFPQINLLWLGCIIMMIGTFMAVRHRIRLSRRKK